MESFLAQVFGEDTAVLAGIALHSLAFEHVARATKGVEADKLISVIAHLGKASGSEGVLAGQIVDIASEGDPNIDMKTLQYIHFHKTATLLEASVVSGAILGGANDHQIDRLCEFSRNIGLLFQVIFLLPRLFITSPRESSFGQSKFSSFIFRKETIIYCRMTTIKICGCFLLLQLLMNRLWMTYST
jgi:hypothetical protein